MAITNTGTPIFERRSTSSYATVWDACYSVEQAEHLADELWKESGGRKRRGPKWVIFRIVIDHGYTCEGKRNIKVYKDYLKKDEVSK